MYTAWSSHYTTEPICCDKIQKTFIIWQSSWVFSIKSKKSVLHRCAILHIFNISWQTILPSKNRAFHAQHSLRDINLKVAILKHPFCQESIHLYLSSDDTLREGKRERRRGGMQQSKVQILRAHSTWRGWSGWVWLSHTVLKCFIWINPKVTNFETILAQ